jgi:8-oxo-dGTP pyrophosphatase MutT (NUDIX family)
MVDVYVARVVDGELRVLLLRRAPDQRCPGSWEAVHGRVEPGESPVAAALREVREESGLPVERLYNLSRVESFYLHRTDEIVVIPVFAAFVAGDAVRLSEEHDQWRWLPAAQAEQTLSWPRGRRAVADLRTLLPGGDAGPLDDVLRVAIDAARPG